MILLDTHALIWLDTDNRKLGAKSRRACDTALRTSSLAASAISFWEVALLTDQERFDPSMPMQEWRGAFLAGGLIEVPVTGEVAIRAAQLKGLPADPADRLIVATALAHDATLLTADRPILEWRGPLKTQDARG